MQGKGLLYGFGGEMYDGEFEKGRRHGMGRQTYRDWTSKEDKYHVYQGQWVDGKREGLGSLFMGKNFTSLTLINIVTRHRRPICEHLQLQRHFWPYNNRARELIITASNSELCKLSFKVSKSEFDKLIRSSQKWRFSFSLKDRIESPSQLCWSLNL